MSVPPGPRTEWSFLNSPKFCGTEWKEDDGGGAAVIKGIGNGPTLGELEDDAGTDKNDGSTVGWHGKDDCATAACRCIGGGDASNGATTGDLEDDAVADVATGDSG